MSDYLAGVQKYDSGADEAVVNKIVKHLGIALRNKDSALVSASDQTELDRVKEKWCAKKLGVTGPVRPSIPVPGPWPATGRSRV